MVVEPATLSHRLAMADLQESLNEPGVSAKALARATELQDDLEATSRLQKKTWWLGLASSAFLLVSAASAENAAVVAISTGGLLIVVLGVVVALRTHTKRIHEITRALGSLSNTDVSEVSGALDTIEEPSRKHGGLDEYDQVERMMATSANVARWLAAAVVGFMVIVFAAFSIW